MNHIRAYEEIIATLGIASVTDNAKMRDIIHIAAVSMMAGGILVLLNEYDSADQLPSNESNEEVKNLVKHEIERYREVCKNFDVACDIFDEYLLFPVYEVIYRL